MAGAQPASAAMPKGYQNSIGTHCSRAAQAARRVAARRRVRPASRVTRDGSRSWPVAAWVAWLPDELGSRRSCHPLERAGPFARLPSRNQLEHVPIEGLDRFELEIVCSWIMNAVEVMAGLADSPISSIHLASLELGEGAVKAD